ncbi:MAG: MBL fold metallo-hydrolase [Balneolaceae bacterium]|nr:MBL fold metallo-hydrolase [Balneolaceae bacterium]
MEIGRYTIEQLSEGRFEVFEDGRFNKLAPGEEETTVPIDLPVQVSTTIGINPILLSSGEHNILLDTGLGWGLDAGSSYTDVSNAVTNLEIFGIAPEDITHVILTHLHYDHAAGCTYTDNDSLTQPTFPNARYILQRNEWEYAVERTGKPNPVQGANYRLDDLYRLFADNYFDLLETERDTILPGITVIRTAGHTPGHQVVRISDGGDTAYYLGDLLPSEQHLNHYAMREVDLHPNQAKKKKIQLLREIYGENACILFYHSLFSKVGRLEKGDKKNYVFKEI